jgi:hypothetical protein
MSSLPALATDSTAPQLPLPPPPRSMRLCDAGKIAAERLDSASISSLKAALAGVTAADAPAGPRLVERIDAAAKLAADANAAAEAVARLKRLLQAQLATRPTSAPPAFTPTPPEAPPPQLLPASPPLAEQPRPDVRGFLAGIILAGAVGAVLYLYMMAG